MHVVDWFPTILSLANISYTDDSMNGVSQATSLLTGTSSNRSTILYDCFANITGATYNLSSTTCGVRNDKYKLLYHWNDTITSQYYDQDYTYDSDDDLDADKAECNFITAGIEFEVLYDVILLIFLLCRNIILLLYISVLFV
jgi:arylsulfatase A-like enzyme